MVARARPAVLLTRGERYDTKSYEELLVRVAETLLARSAGPPAGSDPGSMPLELYE